MQNIIVISLSFILLAGVNSYAKNVLSLIPKQSSIVFGVKVDKKRLKEIKNSNPDITRELSYISMRYFISLDDISMIYGFFTNGAKRPIILGRGNFSKEDIYKGILSVHTGTAAWAIKKEYKGILYISLSSPGKAIVVLDGHTIAIADNDKIKGVIDSFLQSSNRKSILYNKKLFRAIKSNSSNSLFWLVGVLPKGLINKVFIGNKGVNSLKYINIVTAKYKSKGSMDVFELRSVCRSRRQALLVSSSIKQFVNEHMHLISLILQDMPLLLNALERRKFYTKNNVSILRLSISRAEFIGITKALKFRKEDHRAN